MLRKIWSIHESLLPNHPCNQLSKQFLASRRESLPSPPSYYCSAGHWDRVASLSLSGSNRGNKMIFSYCTYPYGTSSLLVSGKGKLLPTNTAFPCLLLVGGSTAHFSLGRELECLQFSAEVLVPSVPGRQEEVCSLIGQLVLSPNYTLKSPELWSLAPEILI